MTVQIIDKIAEKTFLLALTDPQTGPQKHSALYCNFARVKNGPKPATLLPVLMDVLQSDDAVAYFCYDGDVIITWKGFRDAIYKGLTAALGMFLKNGAPHARLDRLFTFYEPYQDKEELRAICRGKIVQYDVEESKAQSVDSRVKPLPRPAIAPLTFTEEQLATLKESLESRTRRKTCEILIVEDQAYVSDTLMNILAEEYHCRTARNVAEAMQLYAAHAADVCLLDITLPDGNGHALAQLFKASDPKSMIIMVSGSGLMPNIAEAKKNSVSAYITKPFSKGKVLDTIAACRRAATREAAQKTA